MGNIFSSDNKNNTESPTAINKTLSFFSHYIGRSFIFILAFLLFTINLTAVSISLQCNKNAGVMFKLSSALFAFMFGIFYIFINYYLYKVQLNNNPCIICTEKVFSF